MVIWFLLPLLYLLLSSLILLIVPETPPPEEIPVEIVDDACYIDTYYSSLNETSCEIEVTFNQRVYPGKIGVAFYDKNDRLLETLYIDIGYYSYDTEHSNTYFTVNGNVDSYEIIDYSDIRSAETDIFLSEKENVESIVAGLWVLWAWFRGIYVIPLTLTALCFSCKQYRCGEHTVTVYAGRMHHYIKVDGIKVDERNALISFSGIFMNNKLPEGDLMEVYISSFTKRITLRCGGVLMTPDL